MGVGVIMRLSRSWGKWGLTPELSVVEGGDGDYTSMVLRCTGSRKYHTRSYRRPSLSHGHA